MKKQNTNKNYTWDVFISYASEDRETVVLPLRDALERNGLLVWLDKDQLTIGDSLRTKIDEGLSKSRFGIVILSKSFFAKNWPQKELNALVSREDNSEKVILPVWHGIDHNTVLSYSPILADKIAVTTDDGIDKVAESILKVIANKTISKEVYLTDDDLNILLEQITWQRYHEGSYKHDDPLLHLKEKITEIIKEEKSPIELSKDELSLLINATSYNVKFVGSYNYGLMAVEEAEQQRQETLYPILSVLKKLRLLYKTASL